MTYKEAMMLPDGAWPTYEMSEISHKDYSHVIVWLDSPTYGEEIIAYKNRKTGVWETTDYLLDHDPELEGSNFTFLETIELFENDRLGQIIGTDKLFIGLL